MFDNGAGIAPSDMDKLVQPMANIENGASHGSGMGLAIASKLAELHDAKLEIESVQGKGTIAKLKFPRERLGMKTSVAA